MKKKDLMFIAMALGVIGLFVFLSLISRKPKPLSARAEHASATKDTPRETCLECHAPTSPIAPMPERHPKKGRPPDKTTPCYACHKFPTGSVSASLLPGLLPARTFGPGIDSRLLEEQVLIDERTKTGDKLVWLNQQQR